MKLQTVYREFCPSAISKYMKECVENLSHETHHQTLGSIYHGEVWNITRRELMMGIWTQVRDDLKTLKNPIKIFGIFKR